MISTIAFLTLLTLWAVLHGKASATRAHREHPVTLLHDGSQCVIFSRRLAASSRPALSISGRGCTLPALQEDDRL